LPGNKAPVATATGKPVAPAAIYWGTKHKVAPPVMGKLYRDQMRQLGGNVQRVQLPRRADALLDAGRGGGALFALGERSLRRQACGERISREIAQWKIVTAKKRVAF
jgi:hypothetical protein